MYKVRGICTVHMYTVCTVCTVLYIHMYIQCMYCMYCAIHTYVYTVYVHICTVVLYTRIYSVCTVCMYYTYVCIYSVCTYVCTVLYTCTVSVYAVAVRSCSNLAHALCMRQFVNRMFVCIACTVLYWEWQVLQNVQWIYWSIRRPCDLATQKFLESILKYICMYKSHITLKRHKEKTHEE